MNNGMFKKNDPRLLGKNNPKWKPKIKKICPICNKKFEVIPSRNFVKCCSQSCGNTLDWQKRKTGINSNCLNCNKEIYIPKHYTGRKKYCSVKCRINHLKTERKQELKEKLSQSHLGQPAWNKGKRFPQYSGENHPNWKGGIAYEDYGIEFNKHLKDKIRQRNNYQCQMCELRENGKNHIVHHIDYDKKNNKSENLILLCNSCHSKTNFTRQDWIKYFREDKCKRLSLLRTTKVSRLVILL